ncbi:hypothetical protein Tco_0396363 [Tanacetum coccineum]
MIPATTSLIGFSGETIWPLGQISLLVKIGDEEHSTSAWMNFMVIRSPSQHNGIIGRTGIRKISVVPSTAHGMLKFPVEGGTVTLRSSRVIPMECAMISGPSTQHPVTSQVLEEKIKVAIHPEYPEQTIAIGSTLTEKGRKELCALLRQNLYAFTWKPADLTGVPRHIAEHRLNVREGCLPIRQKKRGDRLESRVSLRIPFQVLPGRIERISLCLKNARATYQRLVDRAFQKQIGRNLEVYVDDLEGIFLGYKVNADGLKVCPEKADAVLSLPSPGCLKDVQKLNGKLASLNKFLSKSAEKSLPFFKTLKKCIKKSDFQWTQEAEVAFR